MELKYEKKYLKYKKKYLNLKRKLQNKQFTGGAIEYKGDISFNDLNEKLNVLKTNEDLKTIFIVLYAPWCHFCHDFLQGDNYTELIEKYEGNININVNAVDFVGDEFEETEPSDIIEEKKEIGVNKTEFLKELKNYEVMGFPTMIKLTMNVDTSININEFTGDRNKMTDLTQFIET